MGASLFDHLNGGFGVLFGRGGLPRVSLEPRCVGRESLDPKKASTELLVLGAGELEMMGKLMDELAAQRCRGTRHADRQRCRVWSVLGPGVEFPSSLEGYRGYATYSSGMRLEEVAPGFVGKAP